MAQNTTLADYKSQQEQILIELGEYADAAASCDETITRIANLKLDYYQAKDSQVACGISNALLGNRDKAKRYIASLYEATVLVEERRKEIAAIYMALKQHKYVIDTVNGGKDSATENAHKIVEGILTLGFSAVLDHAIRETPLAWQRSSTYPQLFMRAEAYFELKDYDWAKKSYDMALNQSTFRDYGSITFTLLHDRGMITEQEGDIITAIDYYRRSIEELEAKRSTINSEGAKMGFVDDKQSVYKSLIDALIKQNRPVEAFEYVECSKARALVDLLASKKTFTGGQTPTRVNAMLAALDAAETKVQQVASASADGQQRRAGSLQSQTSQISQISQIIKAAPEVGSLVSVDTMSTVNIQAMVKPDEAIIEYFFQGAGALYAFVVRRDDVQIFFAQ